MSDGKRIILGEDDFNEPETQQPPLAQPGGSLPPVKNSGPVKVAASDGPNVQSARNLLYDAKTGPLVAAVAAMAAAWIVTEITGVAGMGVSDTTQEQVNVDTAIWTGLLGVVFGAGVLVFDRLLAREWESSLKEAARAAIPLFVASFITGYIAARVYTALLGNTGDASHGTYYLARSIAWGLFGLGIGAVLGAIQKSKQLATNGLIGGAIGGAIGGITFEFVSSSLDFSAAMSRLVGLIAIGAAIAIATRAVESARREAWLKVIHGGMTGKEFILYHPTTRIGSTPECEIFIVKDPAVDKVHAQIVDVEGRRTLTALSGSVVLVNQAQVTGHQLQSGDNVQIGNTVINYLEKAVQA